MLLGKPEGGVLTLTPAMLKKEHMLQLATSVGEVDLLDRIHGFASYRFLKTKAEIQDVGVATPVLSIDGLLRAKRAMKRPKDLQDIVELEALEEARKLAGPSDDTASIRLRQPNMQKP